MVSPVFINSLAFAPGIPDPTPSPFRFPSRPESLPGSFSSTSFGSATNKKAQWMSSSKPRTTSCWTTYTQNSCQPPHFFRHQPLMGPYGSIHYGSNSFPTSLILRSPTKSLEVIPNSSLPYLHGLETTFHANVCPSSSQPS